MGLAVYVPARIGEGYFTDWTAPASGSTDTGKVWVWNNGTGKYEAATTLTNYTLVTPTIASTGWANANHAHTGSTSGGQLDHGTALTGLGDNDHPQYFLASGVSGYGATLIDDADAATARTTLGLGTIATATETNYLLASGSRAGAVSGLQAFTNGIVTGIVRPPSNSTTAFRVQDAAGSVTLLTGDTTNGMLAATSGYFTLGTAGFDARFYLYSDITNSTNALRRTFYSQLRVDSTTVAITNGQTGLHAKVFHSAGSNDVYGIVGLQGEVQTSAAGTLYEANAFVGTINNFGTGNVLLFQGINIESALNLGGGAITTVRAISVQDQTAATNNYAIYTRRGDVRLMSSDADKLGFHGATPVARQLLATGAGATVDNVITALQNLGLLRQS